MIVKPIFTKRHLQLYQYLFNVDTLLDRPEMVNRKGVVIYEARAPGSGPIAHAVYSRQGTYRLYRVQAFANIF